MFILVLSLAHLVVSPIVVENREYFFIILPTQYFNLCWFMYLNYICGVCLDMKWCVDIPSSSEGTSERDGVSMLSCVHEVTL